jgi:transposase-like protein
MQKRKYTGQFKIDLVLQYIKGGRSQAEICRENGINPNLLNKWVGQFENQASQIFNKGKQDEHQKKIEKLERIIGRQTVEIDFLKRGLSRFSP